MSNNKSSFPFLGMGIIEKCLQFRTSFFINIQYLLSVIVLIGPLSKLIVVVAIELAPFIVAVEVALCCCWTWVEFITADTANLALAVSRVNLEVGCEEND